MCEFSERLVAWLDGELGEGEAAEMERHLAECAQCRGRLDGYRQASDAFEAYCNAYGDAALSVKRGRPSVRRARSIYAAGAIAAAVAAFLIVATAQQEPERHAPDASLTAAAPTEKSTETAYVSKAAPDLRIEALRPEENVDSLGGAAAVEIDIPADAIFPPGAVPAGVGFAADVTMASDGSAEQIRLRPQLTEFQRRGTQR